MKKDVFSFPRWTSAKTKILIYIVFQLCSFGASTISMQAQSSLTGRFVAWIDGPRLTSFGANRQSYIFQVASGPEPQYVILRYSFFLYEPQMPRWAFDYFRVYSFQAVKNDHCMQTLEEISKRFVFDTRGRVVGTQYGINYSKNAPPLTLLSKTPMPCYALSALTVSSIQWNHP